MNEEEDLKDFTTLPLTERIKYLGKFAVVACIDNVEHSLSFKCGTVTSVGPYHINVSGVSSKENYFRNHIYFLGDNREDVINSAILYYDKHLSSGYNKDGWFYPENRAEKFPVYCDLIFIVDRR